MLQRTETQDHTGDFAVLSISFACVAHCLYCRWRYKLLISISAVLHSLCVRGRAGTSVGANDLGEVLLENPPSMMRCSERSLK